MSARGPGVTPDPVTVDWPKIKTGLQKLRRQTGIGLIVVVLASAGLVTLLPPLHTKAAGANMMLFWDPANGSIPANWCKVTSYDGYFPRGDTPANFGITTDAPGRPYTPSTTTGSGSVTVSGASATANGNGNSTSVSAATHTNPTPTVTVSTDDNGDATNPNIPAYRSLQLMIYDNGGGCTGTGIPNIIPANAIAMFDSLPSGWTRLTDYDNKLIRIKNGNVETGGNDYVNNTVTISSLGNASGSTARNTFLGLENIPTATSGHTHNAPSSVTCTIGCAVTSCPSFVCKATNVIPRYVQPLLAKADSDTPTLSLNIMAMFDGDPGSGWAVLSNSSGTNPYYQQFIRPGATANLASQGSDTRTQRYVGTTGQANGGSGGLTTNFNQAAARQTHTHTITGNTDSLSNVPPYVNVVIAQKVSFTLTAYQWYVENDAENVTDPWPSGSLNVAQNSQIPAVPAPYSPPVEGNNLRIRVQMRVNGGALPAGTVAFKLQYSQGPAGSDCTSGSWLDVNSSSSTARPWRYGTNSLTDGSTLLTNKLASTRLENFYMSSSTGAGFINPNAAASGETIEYDWLIQNYQAARGSQFNFRVVENQGVADSGILLSLYSTCPSVVTKPATEQLLRHGGFFQDGAEKGFTWAD